LWWRCRCKYDGEEGKERETKRKRTKTKVGRGIKGKEMKVNSGSWADKFKSWEEGDKESNNKKETKEEIGCVR
jgi:hypothetical protein